MPIWLQIFFAVITCVCAVFNVIIGIMALRNKKKTQIIEKYLNNKFNVNIDKHLENHNETTHIYYPQISNNNGYSLKDVSYFLEQQQKIKINKIVSKACETTTINVINDKLKDLNWAYTFFNDSKNSSTEIIMDIWANVLAGKNKATFKLLNFLSNMNSNDAKLFMEVLPLFYGTALIKNANDKTGGIGNFSYSELLKLKDAGLIDLSLLGYDIRLSPKEKKLILETSKYNIWFINNSDKEQRYFIKCYRLTEIGSELSTYLKYEVNEEFTIKMFEILKNMNKNKNITFDIVSKKDAEVKSNDIDTSHNGILS